MLWRLWGLIALLISLIVSGIVVQVKLPADKLVFEPRFQTGRGHIQGVSWHPSSDYLSVNTITGAWIYTDALADMAHLPEAKHAVFSPDGNWLVGSQGAEVTLWDATTFAPVARLQGHQAEVIVLAWNPVHPEQLATVDAGGQLIVWNIELGTIIHQENNFLGSSPSKLEWNSSGMQLAGIDVEGAFAVFDIEQSKTQLRLPKVGPASSLWGDRSGYNFVWLTENSIFRLSLEATKYEIWDTITLTDVTDSSIYDYYYFIESIGYTGASIPSPNGLYRAEANLSFTIASKPTIQIFSQVDNTLVQQVAPHIESPWGMVWSPDSRKLISYGWLDDLIVSDIITGQILGKGQYHSGLGRVLSWRADGQVIATSGLLSTGHLWDAQTGELLAVLRGHPYPLAYLAWQPLGHLLATSGRGFGNQFSWQDTNLFIWDTTNILDEGYVDLFSPIVKLTFDKPVEGISWSSNGRFLAIYMGTRLEIWDSVSQKITQVIDPGFVTLMRRTNDIAPSPIWMHGDQVIAAPINYTHQFRSFFVANGLPVDPQFSSTRYINNDIEDGFEYQLVDLNGPLIIRKTRIPQPASLVLRGTYSIEDGNDVYDLVIIRERNEQEFIFDTVSSQPLGQLMLSDDYSAWVESQTIAFSPDSRQIAQLVEGTLVVWESQEVCTQWPDLLRDVLVRQRPWCE